MSSKALWRIWISGVFLALAGAIWSAVTGVGCRECQAASELVGGHVLGWLGVGFYALLALWMRLHPGKNRVSCRMTLAAAGTHLVLISLLIKARLFCPPCTVTALGAFVATGGCLPFADLRFSRDGWPLPVVASVALISIVLFQRAQAREYDRLGSQLFKQVLAEHLLPSRSAEVLLIVYERAGCRYCQDLNEHCLQSLKHEWVHWKIRPAPKGLPTPTVILLGKHPTFIVGWRSCNVYSKAVEMVNSE